MAKKFKRKKIKISVPTEKAAALVFVKNDGRAGATLGLELNLS